MDNRLVALAISVAMCGSSTPCFAGGDVDPISASQWNGFYAGGHLGGAWGDSSWAYKNPNWFNTLGPEIVISNFAVDAGGFVGGGQTGFTIQSGAWVFGVEGAFAGTTIDGDVKSPFFPEADSYQVDVSSLAAVVGRLGYAWGRWLAYGKGGWAGADVELTLFDQVTPVRAKSSAWSNGYTLGGGAEYALSDGFSLGVDYAYIDLDTGRFVVQCPTCPLGIGGGVPAVDSNIQIQSVTARINYRFGN
jgi:outer membrane immunogenic protein